MGGAQCPSQNQMRKKNKAYQTSPLLAFLWQAYHAEYGLSIHDQNPATLRQKLYPLRKTNQKLTTLSLILPPQQYTLWIVHASKIK